MTNLQTSQCDSSSASAAAAQRTNYSEAEQAQFREEFRRRAKRVTKLRRVMAFAVIAFFIMVLGYFAVGIILSTNGRAMPGAAGVAIPLAALVFGIALVALFWHRRLRCPACHQRMFDRFGPFCPECGSRSLGPPDPCDLVPIHPCTACGRKFRWGKGANLFRLRHCSHCGMFLDEQGLEMP